MIDVKLKINTFVTRNNKKIKSTLIMEVKFPGFVPYVIR
jgi:hypothetical protein